MAMRSLVIAATFAVSLGSLAKVKVTPVEKVIDLLKSLEADTQGESASEAATYETFSCFCKDKTKSLSENIQSGKDSIDSLAAELQLKNATRAEKTTDLQEAKVSLEEATVKLQETEVRAAKEKAEYQANDADLSKAISSLAQAVSSMKESKMTPTAALLSMQRPEVHSAALDGAMRLLDAGWKKNTAFLQLRASVDPNDPAYKFHAGDIIATMEGLHEEFTQKKAEADAEYAKMKAASDKLIGELNTEIGTTTDQISTLEEDIATLTQRLAEAREELLDADAVMKDDKLYLTDLTELCEKRAQEWDQRSAMRADELKAVQQAIEILENKVVSTSEVSERALIQKPVSFLQKAAVNEHSQAQVQEEHKNNAIELLATESRRLGSSALMAVVARASADPFAKIKNLLQSLVERLIKEATEEATKKGYCDTEQGKAKKDREYRLQDVMTLSAEIAQMEATEDELSQEMGDLKDRLGDLASTANETAAMRETEKAENLHTLAESKEGLIAVKEAMGILNTFYKAAAKATSLLQVKGAASPVDEDNPGAGFDGNYGGNQAKSKGIIGVLEVIVSDFERTIKVTEQQEKEAAADFVEFDRATKGEQSGKGTKSELDADDLETTKINLVKASEDMKSNMNLLDAALMELEELVPMCVDNVMTYEERVQKREEEISALNTALCILDPEGVEEECQGGMPQKL